MLINKYLEIKNSICLFLSASNVTSVNIRNKWEFSSYHNTTTRTEFQKMAYTNIHLMRSLKMCLAENLAFFWFSISTLDLFFSFYYSTFFCHFFRKYLNHNVHRTDWKWSWIETWLQMYATFFIKIEVWVDSKQYPIWSQNTKITKIVFKMKSLTHCKY